MNTEKFTGKSGVYAKYRPSYPVALIDYLYNKLGFSKESLIADVGFGDGDYLRAFARTGSKVFGIEPNADMRDKAVESLSRYSNFVSVDGTSESTTLPDGRRRFRHGGAGFPLVRQRAVPGECARIHPTRRLVVLVWNSRATDSALVAENAGVCRKFCPAFKGFSGGDENDTKAFSQFFKNGVYEDRMIPNDLLFDPHGFVGRNLSHPMRPRDDPNYQTVRQGDFETCSRVTRPDGILTMLTSRGATRTNAGIPDRRMCRSVSVKDFDRRPVGLRSVRTPGAV
jgi:hypothetical protein